MNEQQAKDLVKSTLENPFDKGKFTHFVRNLLNRIDEAKAFHARGYVPESYKKYVKTYERLATYTDPEGLKIDILIVYLQNETTLERARTSQRNFIAHYLKDRDQKDAGLVAFVAPEHSDWRFSLVKMDYSFEEGKKGKIKVKEEFTPARRWSFLVGQNENSHTAQTRLLPIMADDGHPPTLAELEEVFNIETVTKEFFVEYRNLFILVKESLDAIVKKDSTIKNNFEQNGVNTVDFAKKLLGQIVFLYFLQKKGWFGVIKNAAWGTGSKQFLRELFEKKHSGYNNFFNDILEPLFYEALRLDRGHEDHYYSRFNCKIPFLNGGLFDPIKGYDWVNTDILLANELFSNKHKTNEGDTGNGILDVFDRYNFTVKEDEPLEKEVAIDPELLGKAYEKFNAIRPDNFAEYKQALKSGKKGEESKFNKQFGVYYTPREIVHYMCQQSLINYLSAQFNGGVVIYEKPGETQTDLVGNIGKKGQLDLTIEHTENPVILKVDIETLIHLGERLTENEEMALIKQQKINEGHQKTSDYKLQLPKSIRNNAKVIDEKLATVKICDPAIGSGAFPVGMMNEIIRARNVLSNFIKDAENTVYKFKRDCIENSLYGVDIDSGAVEIAKLRLWLSLVVDEDDIKNIKPLPNLDYKIVCGDSLIGFPEKWDSPATKEIEYLKNQYFSETNPTRKKELKEKIDVKINDRYEKSLQTFGYKVNFDFRLAFSEVFHEKDGFDIVLGNPPYGVSIKGNYRKSVLDLLGKVPDFEIYYYFIEKAFRLLKANGIKTYIIPNTILFNTFAKKYREAMMRRWDILEILDCSDFNIFENVTVRNIITLFSKSNILDYVGYRNTSNVNNFQELILKEYATIAKNDLLVNNQNWSLSFKISSNILNVTSKIKKSCNVLNAYFPNISQGLIAYDKYQGQSDATIKNRIFHSFEKKTNYKPWLWGEDITRYKVEWNGQEYVNYCDKIANPRKPIFFKSDRILIREITNPSIYAGFTNEELYNDPSVIIILKGEIIHLFCILGILNSKFASFFHFNSAPKAIKGAFPKILVEDIKFFPLPHVLENYNIQKQFIKIVDKILNIMKDTDYIDNLTKQTKVKEYEKEIDLMVYKLYDLTPEEIKIVEGL